MNDDLAILQLLNTKGLGPSKMRRLFARLREESATPLDLFHIDADELNLIYELKPETVEAFKMANEHAEPLLNLLQENDIRIISLFSSMYPQRLLNVLGDKAPPVLFAKGNLELLSAPSVGFCGSRKASERSLQIASACASILSQHCINIVSGYASGVDMATHKAALEAGGSSTFVLAEGILRFSSKKDIAELINENNALVLSEFSPLLTWQAHNAMQRNRTICGLSNAMILVESGMNGGTFAAGEDTLKLGRPLFVVDYEEAGSDFEGNTYFIRRGASPLRGDTESHPNLHEVMSVLNEEGDPQPAQGMLF